MKTFNVELVGESAILMHNDNISWADMMKVWGNDPANKEVSVAGDDRTPSWRWLGSLYVDMGKIVIPSDNLMSVLREGGKRCPTGNGKKTFKSQSQSGLLVDQASWPIIVNGKEIDAEEVFLLKDEPDFSVHEKAVRQWGFELFVKRAAIGASKHVRVRPRFNNWSCSGTITVLDDMITKSVLQNILTYAGVYGGIGDWRPSSPKAPGPFGKFTAKVI